MSEKDLYDGKYTKLGDGYIFDALRHGATRNETKEYRSRLREKTDSLFMSEIEEKVEKLVSEDMNESGIFYRDLRNKSEMLRNSLKSIVELIVSDLEREGVYMSDCMSEYLKYKEMIESSSNKRKPFYSFEKAKERLAFEWVEAQVKKVRKTENKRLDEKAVDFRKIENELRRNRMDMNAAEEEIVTHSGDDKLISDYKKWLLSNRYLRVIEEYPDLLIGEGDQNLDDMR